jgi:plasmid maintenance system antidote protein VapI
MDATGTNNQRLARRLGVAESHLSNVLRKSRRCSLYLALKLSKITNVPIESICQWPPEYEEAVK